jgi:hypothetical protein
MRRFCRATTENKKEETTYHPKGNARSGHFQGSKEKQGIKIMRYFPDWLAKAAAAHLTKSSITIEVASSPGHRQSK